MPSKKPSEKPKTEPPPPDKVSGPMRIVTFGLGATLVGLGIADVVFDPWAIAADKLILAGSGMTAIAYTGKKDGGNGKS